MGRDGCAGVGPSSAAVTDGEEDGRRGDAMETGSFECLTVGTMSVLLRAEGDK